jgi:outer membrane protein W
MKKIILTVAAVFAFGFANAQDKKESGSGYAKGDLFVTGAFTLGSTNDKNSEEKTNGFEIAPQVNYFVTENISLGARIGYATGKAETAGTTTADNSTLGFGLAGRYYFTPASQFSLFAELGVDYSSLTNNMPGSDYKFNEFGLALAPGLNYFVSNNFSIEAKVAVLGFASGKSNVTGDKGESAFAFGGDWRAVSFGVNYKF